MVNLVWTSSVSVCVCGCVVFVVVTWLFHVSLHIHGDLWVTEYVFLWYPYDDLLSVACGCLNAVARFSFFFFYLCGLGRLGN